MTLPQYPRPLADTGRGVHWSPAPAQWGQENWGFWRDFLVAANIKWVKVMDDGGGSARGLIARLASLGIMPVVRFYRQPSYPGFLTARETDYARALYEKYGVVYFETRNEPDLALEWGGQRPANWLEQVISYYLDDRDKLAKVGVYTLFPAFGPGGEGNPFEIIVKRGRKDVFESMLVALHNYCLGRPLSYPNDGIADLGQPLSYNEWLAAGDGRPDLALNVVWDRWTHTRVSEARRQLAKPQLTIYDDWTCFRAFERMDRLVRDACGHSVGMMMTEGGYNVLQRAGATGGDDPRYPKPTPQRTSELSMAMFNYPLPDYMLALMPWIVGVAQFGVQSPGFEHQGPWFTNIYDREWGLRGQLPLVDMLKADPGRVRVHGPLPAALARFAGAQQFEDRRLDERLKFLEPPVLLEPYQGSGDYWKLVDVQFKEKGNGYIYVRAEDAHGAPLEGITFAAYTKTNEARTAATKGKADHYWGNLPMFGAPLGAFRVGISNQPSDVLSGVGNGSEAGFRQVDYLLTFRKVERQSQAMLNVPQWRQTMLSAYAQSGEVYNNTNASEISIKKATAEGQEQWLWRVIGIRLLTAAESGSNQYLYVDLVDKTGQPVRGATPLVGWTWEGRRPSEPAPPIRPDKPAGEAACNIALNQGLKISAWVQDGAIPSDTALNFQAAPPRTTASGGAVNPSRSFYVLFQKQSVAAAPQPQPPAAGIEIFKKYRISFVFDEEKLTIEDVKITKL